MTCLCTSAYIEYLKRKGGEHFVLCQSILSSHPITNSQAAGCLGSKNQLDRKSRMHGRRCGTGNAAADAGAGVPDSIHRWQLRLCVEPAAVDACHVHGAVCARPHAVRWPAGARFSHACWQPGQPTALPRIPVLMVNLKSWSYLSRNVGSS